MKLNTLTNIATGYPFRGKITEQVQSGIYAVQMKNILPETGINWHNCIETKLEGKRTPIWLQAGNILLAARGNNNYAVLVDDDAAQIKAVASPHFYILSIKNPKVLPAYLCWYINRKPAQRYFQREAEGTFTKSIRRHVVENLPVALPDIEKQHNIIQLFTSIRREQQLLKQLTRNGENLMNTIASDLFQQS